MISAKPNVEVGTVLAPMRVTVRPDDIKIFALILRDPNPIHFDVGAVARAGLGDVAVNQGGSTMAHVMNLLIDFAGSRAALQSINCRFKANVFAGDEVELGGVVTATQSRPDGILAECDVWADVVGGGRAISGTAQVTFVRVAR